MGRKKVERAFLHTGHVLRFSESSRYDYVCVNCGETDDVPGGQGKLADPCPKPVGQGGINLEEWEAGPRD